MNPLCMGESTSSTRMIGPEADPPNFRERPAWFLPAGEKAVIAHVWSSGEALTLDPASGVQGDSVVTTKYNDFVNLGRMSTTGQWSAWSPWHQAFRTQ